MKTAASISSEDLEKLRNITTPTIANAIERLKIRRNTEGYTDPTIRCFFPELDPIAGYACTAVIRSRQPNPKPKYSSRGPYWDYVQGCPVPRIAVVQDLDQPPAGAYFGEVNSNIHKRLGCVGVITDGSVRDLDESRALGFPFFASAVSVSHAYAHLEDFNVTVRVGGLEVRPGDLLVADKHGAILIPAGTERDVIAAAKEIEQYERPMIELCKSPEFSTERLAELLERG